jgi:hypothetical protein
MEIFGPDRCMFQRYIAVDMVSCSYTFVFRVEIRFTWRCDRGSA